MFNIIKTPIKIRPIIALIGGAGPDAAIDLQIKLLGAMKEKLNINFDQEHYRVIVDNNTELPNRDEAILYNGPSPLLTYIDSAKKLENIGANILLISCNAAHAYFHNIQKITKMKMISIIEETASFIGKNHTSIKRLGLLSTSATIQNGLYQQAFNKYNVEVIIPNLEYQTNIMQAIYGIKAGFIDGMQLLDASNKSKLYNIYKRVAEIKSVEQVKHPKHLLRSAIKYFEQQGIEAVILGCTEIPLVLNKKTYAGGCILIDPTEILANATVDYAISLESKMQKVS